MRFYEPMSNSSKYGQTWFSGCQFSSFSLMFSPRQGFCTHLPLIWDCLTKWFGGWSLILTNSNLWKSLVVYQGQCLCKSGVLLVYVSTGVQGYIILGHTSTENQNEAKRGLCNQVLNGDTHTPLSEKDKEGRLSSHGFGLKGVSKTMIVQRNSKSQVYVLKGLLTESHLLEERFEKGKWLLETLSLQKLQRGSLVLEWATRGPIYRVGEQL